jgi:3-oxoacyl-[acyl-carrier protein] reductase
MELFLKGKIALVTGGTSGIGLAIVETLAAEGVKVAFCARNAEQVAQTEKRLNEKGYNTIGTSLDVTKKEALQNWVTATVNSFGGIDILISNVGAIALTVNDEAWQQNFNTDLMPAVHLVEMTKPHLEKAAKEKGDAAIIFISSIAAARAEMESAYGPIKAALIHYAKGVASQQALKKIRANVVSPGNIYVEDGIWGNLQRENPERFQEVVSRNPTGRMGTPQEIANAVVFLASSVSSYTTGINLIVDGAFLSRVNF